VYQNQAGMAQSAVAAYIFNNSDILVDVG